MQTIVINSQKGGSGKTSLCAHLSVEAERTGNSPVYLIDTDPQGTLSTWHESRKAEFPRRVEVSIDGLAAGLATLRGRKAALFNLADLVLVPIRPSPSDLWAVSATVALLKQTRTPFLFIVTQATRNANITAQAIAALSHHGRVAETIIANRVPYAAAMTDGRTAQELTTKGQAAREIASLWQNVQACLHDSMKTS